MNVPYWWNQTRKQALLSKMGSRLVGEIEYLASLALPDRKSSAPDARARDEAITGAMHAVRDAVARAGTLSDEVGHRIEEELAPLGEVARSLTMHFVGHAHLDMNWMWGYDETVVIVLETMRTVLRLLDEYPDFCFSQSQGAVYRIVEQYEPELLDGIGRYVKEGRWELSATQWTETDMNLPDAESLLRHALLTVPYLKGLFGVDRDALRLAFMPDTFGHSADTPEILAEAGVSWVYHCRGFAGPALSRWVAPSGRSVLAYREPRWYNEEVAPSLFAAAAATSHEVGVDQVLAVYGVGDHGGGPTRRDIELIADMQQWPLAPRIQFSTYREFFPAVEATIDPPAVSGERNRIFTGCYSSQARIKAGNRDGQRMLYTAEALAALCGTATAGRLTEAWRGVLFNQFHDILPGSGVPATRTWALAAYQQVAAAAQSEINRALRTASDKVATAAADYIRSIVDDGEWLHDDTAEGAGVGFTVATARASATGRWGGIVRPFFVVNPLEVARETYVEIVVWDYSISEIEVVDEAGELLDSQVIRSGEDSYWNHTFVVVLVRLDLKPWEYRTLFVRPRALVPLNSDHHPYGVDNWLVDHKPELRLRGDRLEVAIDTTTLAISSIVDTTSGAELLGPGGARFVLEFEDQAHMSAWYTQRAGVGQDLGPGGRVKAVTTGKERLRSWIDLELPFSSRGLAPDHGGSLLKLRVELDRTSSMLRLVAAVRFREVAAADVGIPKLVLRVDAGFPIGGAVRDIPVGTLESSLDGDPHAAQSGMTVYGSSESLTLVGREVQSYTATDRSVAATLLRGTDAPDPAPELGDHSFAFYLGTHDLEHDHGARRLLVEPQVISVARPTQDSLDGGDRAPLRGHLASVRADNARVVALKAAEERAGSLVLRAAAGTAGGGSLVVAFPAPPVGAEVVNAAEESIAAEEPIAAEEHVSPDRVAVELSNGEVSVTIPAARVVSVRIDFA